MPVISPAQITADHTLPCAHDPAGLVGNTPVLWIDRPFSKPGRGFWAKLEGHNPGGIKDRPALHMIAKARENGLLRPGAPIVESSSGTFALGLALAGTVYGHPVAIVTDPGLEPGMHRLLSAYGATVAIAERPHRTGGWQQARRDLVTAIRREQPDAYCPNQYDNPDNIAAYAPLAHELGTQLGDIDVLVCSVGTGGHSAGIAGVLRDTNPQLRLIGVDTIGSVLFGQPDRPRLMRGLGSSIRPANVRHDMFTEVHWVAPSEAVWACRQLAATHCVTGGWSVGAVALVAGWAARTHPPGTRIAAVFPDGPHRYVDTVFNDEFCRAHGILIDQPSEGPALLGHPGQCEVTRWSRCTNVVAGKR